jgi:DnaJ-domain-containing protein 1
MLLLWFLAGVILVIALHASFSLLQNLSASAKSRMRKALLIASALLGGFVLLRVGLPYLAALFGALMIAVNYAARIASAGAMLLPLLMPFFLRRKAADASPSTSASRMSLSQARAILGVQERASEQEIKAAYYALIQKLHPDVGGNDYLAAQLNEAKDILLNANKKQGL